MKLSHLALVSAICTNVYAEDVKIVGTLTIPLKLPVSASSALKNSPKTADSGNNIELLKIDLSPQAKKNLAARTNAAISHSKQFAANLESTPFPRKIALGMNEVPVLNQGEHGTCVTFAVTAAFDAILNKGDYLSQLCQLQFGNYLEKNAYTYSGWKGSFGLTVLNQTEMFGVVPKAQEQQGCGGLTSYPIKGNAKTDGSISIEEYRQMSEDLHDHIQWSTILDHTKAFADRIDTNQIVKEIKASLNEGDRVTIGVLLASYEYGVAGAVGKHHSVNDSWVLTSEIARDVYINPKFGGHEMVITGYDDDAVALDEHGYEHRGLFTLRNSWSDKAGDQGDFYMSYDYFKLLAMEAARIRAVSEENDEE
ncbi:MAG: C1 family peptidase [Tatlockia sp.]|nr:C1 family peptidase [Tatlockia sp.]